MTPLIVIGCILAFLLLLLLTPIRLRAGYSAEKFTLYLGILFFRLNLSPDHLSEPTRRKKDKPSKAKKKEQPPKQKKQTDADREKPDMLKELLPLIRASGRAVRRIGRRLILYDIEIYGSIGSEDAHKTALLYGRVSAVVPLLISILNELCVVRTPTVRLAPDFTRGKSMWDISLALRIQPVTLLGAGISLLIAYLKHTRKQPAQGQKKRKGGHLHESATSHQ